ncbi:hypothetical protein GX441_08680 [bacterium]|nr:hypothetical protein [bacterium]
MRWVISQIPLTTAKGQEFFFVEKDCLTEVNQDIKEQKPLFGGIYA